MKKMSSKQKRAELAALAALPENQIDTSDIPEITAEQFRQATRGLMYRPVKKPVTMRLDADVLQWLKKDGPGYQTKANHILRRAMIRGYQGKKGPDRAPKVGVRRKSGAR